MDKRREQTPHQNIEMANKHMKSCSTSDVINELTIKTAVRYYCVPTRMAKIQNTDNI